MATSARSIESWGWFSTYPPLGSALRPLGCYSILIQLGDIRCQVGSGLAKVAAGDRGLSGDCHRRRCLAAVAAYGRRVMKGDGRARWPAHGL